ncbi:MAG TPA: hypothetical protein VK605_00080 [Solirubrobacteraceae bacterium]|nr:hypothetical protein [Solirubrobacteraceae bacterium]
MTQISRPLQIALVAIVLFAAVWFVALRGHSSGGESSSSPASSSAQPASPEPASPSSSGAGSSGSSGSSGSAGSSPSSGSTYHGSAPGVAGLTRAIAKARGAVAQSQKQAAAQSGAKHTSGSPSSSSTHASKAGSHTGSSAGANAAAPSGGAKGSSGKATPSGSSTKQTAGVPAKQAIVQSELKHGQTVVILFWNRKGSDDVAVHVELRLLQIVGKRLLPEDRKLAFHYARAGEVGQFGSITHSLQVLQTPTTLVISPSGDAKTLTGLVDAYTIQQAIREARHPSRHP